MRNITIMFHDNTTHIDRKKWKKVMWETVNCPKSKGGQTKLEDDAGVDVHALSNVCHVDVERISKRKPGECFPYPFFPA
ncbi:hypothetical protein GQ457_10G022700 [Hibiscus cannabinus]